MAEQEAFFKPLACALWNSWHHCRGPLQAMTPPPDPWQSGGRPGSGRQRNEAAVSRWSSAVAGVSAAMHQGQGRRVWWYCKGGQGT
eukprot:344559-Pelagomonas_calceolata.AAC.1